jgi:predicted phage terminase large subunit-like protein
MQSSPTGWRQLGHESNLRSSVRTNLLDWAAHVLKYSDQTPAAHHRLLLQELQALSLGTIDRLLVHMPPGSAKSTYASTFFPVWWFGQHPGSSIIAASHTESLAAHFGRRVRDLIATEQPRLGYNLIKGARSTLQWRLSNGSEYFAVGTRGSVIGRRADLVIVDDPIGSLAQADRSVDRNRIWDWFRSDLTTRLKPKGRILIVMTRWHEDDLAGRLAEYANDNWRVIKLPAVAEENDQLGRTPGEPLWPQWEDLAALQRKRASVGERTWNAAYQQSPRPLEGGLFKVGGIVPVDQSERADGLTVRAWDLAATIATGSNDPDWTVGVKLRVERPGQFLVLDVIRMRGSARQIEQTIVGAARLDGTSVHIGFPEDPGQAGKSQVSQYVGLLAGFHVVATRESGSKLLRAQPLSSQIESGNLSIVRADWNRVFLDELRDFPFDGKDDQVDALVRAFTTINNLSGSTRRIAVPFLVR